MAIYKENIVNIDLNSGTIFRSFVNRAIGSGDDDADRFGVCVFRGSDPVNLTGVSCQGFFRNSRGENIALTSHGTVQGNKAFVTLPQACYNYDGQFTLAIKLVGGGVTGTMRIVDGMVDNTHTGSAVAPTESVPTYQEILAIYEEMVEATEAAEEIADALFSDSVDLTEYETIGKYISKYGVITTTSTPIAISMPIPVEKGKRYILNAMATDQCAAICECSADGSNIRVVQSYEATSQYERNVYEAIKDGYIAVVYNYERIHVLEQEVNIYETAQERENLIDLSEVVIGKDWTGGTNTKRAILTIQAEPNEDYYIEVPESNNIWGTSIIQKNRDRTEPIQSATVNKGNAAVINTRKNTNQIIIQFAGTNDIQSSDFDNYNVILYKGQEPEKKTAVDTEGRSVFSLRENLTNIEDFEIGKDWTGGSNNQRAVIAAPVKPNTVYTIEVPERTNIWGVSLVQKKDKWNTALANQSITPGTKETFITENEAYWLYVQINSNTDITSAMLDNYNIFLHEGINKKECADHEAREAAKGWKNKRMVWFGTSIPAAGKYGLDNRHAYPDMVGDILGSTVYNEAVGSSALHSKMPDLISASNPYGFMNNFEAVSRCLTNSLEEMEWIIEHYNDQAVFTINVPEELTEDDKDFIRSCSWEEKLMKYLTDETFPDVWVFDHGHNDNPTEESEATYTARDNLSGTSHDGYYVNGTYISSTQSSYIEYDVASIKEVFLSETNGAGYDTYDLFDGGGNLLTYKANSIQREVSGFLIDTSGAAILRVSNPNNMISTISVNKYKYGSMYNSLYSYQGCMDFLINKIKEYKPSARIVMIGEYEDQKFPLVSYYQKKVAERWLFPLYKQWENLGLSQQPIKVDGEYKTMFSILIPDNLHPHTDTSGYIEKLMAENIAAWFGTIR